MRSHYAANARLDSPFERHERRRGKLVHAGIYNWQGQVRVNPRAAMPGKMLCAGKHASVAHTPYHGRAEAGHRLSVRTEAPVPYHRAAVVAVNVHDRRKVIIQAKLAQGLSNMPGYGIRIFGAVCSRYLPCRGRVYYILGQPLYPASLLICAYKRLHARLAYSHVPKRGAKLPELPG